MKNLFDRDEVLFAVLWIVVYVVGFSCADAASEMIGMPKAVTVGFGLGLSVFLLAFISRHRLGEYFGLCGFKGSFKKFAYFIPLAIVSSVNLWNGLTLNYSIPVSIFSVISMCFVGILEEVIFRGFLFKGMCKSGVRSAIVVSSLTFGVGHIVNLLRGEPILGTLLQLVYASAIGFCYTAVFYRGGSIIPCIFSHVLVNSLSIFAVEPSAGIQIAIAVFQTAISVGYGAWLMYTGSDGKKRTADKGAACL